MIRVVVLEVLDSNQKNRLMQDAGMEASGQESAHMPALLQGEAELAYLTHEGLFISDALNEAQQRQAAVPDQNSATGSMIQPGRSETDSTRESSFM